MSYQNSMYHLQQESKGKRRTQRMMEEQEMKPRQQFPPVGLNGQWQSEADIVHRRRMIHEIATVLQLQDKNSSASPEWLRKLPHMVKQLEVSLYRSAPSLEAYCDTSTLKYRLQELYMQIQAQNQQQQQMREHTVKQQYDREQQHEQQREPDQQSDRSDVP